jgi:hypothetical protein
MNIMLLLMFDSTLLIIPESLLKILILIIFFLPIIFQSAIGLKALRGKIRMRFRTVCVVSIVSQIVLTSCFLLLMTHNMKKYGIRDGLGFVFAEMSGVLMIVIIFIVVAAQLLINWKSNKTTANK